MQLTREKGQRMWGGGGSSIAGGGGGGGTSLAGYATESWVDDNYISKAFWSELFVIHTSTTTTVKDSGGNIISGPTTVNTTTLDPNTIPGTTETTDEATGNVTIVTVAITSIEAKKGLWTDFFISALGKNASGTGGVLSLNDLVNVEISNPQSGEVLKYNGSKWVNGTGGGGGGSTAWADITGKPTTIAGYGITDAKIVSGTIYLGSSSITPITTETDPTVPAWAKTPTKPSYSFSELTNHPTTLSGYGITDAYTKSEVYNKTEADERFLTIAFFSRLFQAKNGSTNVNPNDTTSTIDNIKALFGFWTDQYLSALGQNSSGGGGGGSSTLAGLNDVQLGTLNANDVLTYDGNGHWVNTSKSTFLSGYATQTWIGQQNYLTSVAFVDLTSHPTTLGGYGITDAYISSGTIYLGSNSITPVTTETDPTVPAWAKASTKPSYSFSELTNHPTTLSGYGITDAVNSSTTWWGQSISNGAVTGSLSSVVNITMSGELYMQGGKHIYFKSGNSYLNAFEFDNTQLAVGYGFRTTNELQLYGSEIVLIANGVEKARATSKGLQIGDAVIVWDSFNNALKITKYSGDSEVACNLYTTGGVSALGLSTGGSIDNLNVTTSIKMNPNARIYQEITTEDRYLYIGRSDNAGWVGLADMCSQAGPEKWYIYAATGEASFMTSVRSARFYLDSSRYLYVSNGTLYYYNGTTPKQVAFTN